MLFLILTSNHHVAVLTMTSCLKRVIFSNSKTLMKTKDVNFLSAENTKKGSWNSWWKFMLVRRLWTDASKIWSLLIKDAWVCLPKVRLDHITMLYSNFLVRIFHRCSVLMCHSSLFLHTNANHHAHQVPTLHLYSIMHTKLQHCNFSDWHFEDNLRGVALKVT